ncbi:cell wall-binding repeat-containing protein [Stomatohabitans albus]|uniref:cell wall-binding repeat-containing protein n=1 Tax=Stomatohabitans albus TaxID=3110766 RepID=UPI00300C1D68
MSDGVTENNLVSQPDTTHREPTAGFSFLLLSLATALMTVLSSAPPVSAHAPLRDDQAVANMQDGMTYPTPDDQMGGSKIVGGRIIPDPGRYGLVQVLTFNNDKKAYRCGGTALSNNWVATSAHCLSRATIGIQVYATPLDTSRRKAGVNVDRIESMSDIQSSGEHPSTDLVLLHVPNLPPDVQPVPVVVAGLPSDNQLVGVAFSRHNLNVADHTWTRTADNAALAIDLPVQARTLCSGGNQNEAIVCAGKPWEPNLLSPNEDFCTGDSGSPLGVLTNGRFGVVGVESRSSIMHANPSWADTRPNERCGFAPTIATSLRHHLGFLTRVIGPDLMTITLPLMSDNGANTLDISNPRGGVDLRTPPSKGDPGQGIRVALQIARARFARNPAVGQHVLLASNTSFADALSSAALQRNSVLLFTDRNILPNAVIAQLQAMGTRRITVLGGPAIIADTVLHQARTLGIQVDRIAGPDRLSTAGAVASRLDTNLSSRSGAYLLRAFGNGSSAFADSLAAGAAAARRNWPVLLTSTESLSAPAMNLLKNRPEVVIVGGPAAISYQVRLQVAGLVPRVGQAMGADRTKTAELLAQPASPTQSVIVLDGFDPGAWHGGFAASGLAADIDAPILLTNPATNGADIAAQLDGMSPTADASFVCIADKALCDAFYHLWLN